MPDQHLLICFSPATCAILKGSFLTIGDGAEFTVFGKITGDILAEVTGITFGLFVSLAASAVERKTRHL